MNARTAVVITTFYLIIYAGLAASGYAYLVVACLYLVSPIVILGMAYIVLKDDHDDYPELAEGEEWGYADKAKEELGLF